MATSGPARVSDVELFIKLSPELYTFHLLPFHVNASRKQTVDRHSFYIWLERFYCLLKIEVVNRKRCSMSCVHQTEEWTCMSLVDMPSLLLTHSSNNWHNELKGPPGF